MYKRGGGFVGDCHINLGECNGVDMLRHRVSRGGLTLFNVKGQGQVLMRLLC